jgi:hypothetical protein
MNSEDRLEREKQRGRRIAENITRLQTLTDNECRHSECIALRNRSEVVRARVAILLRMPNPYETKSLVPAICLLGKEASGREKGLYNLAIGRVRRTKGDRGCWRWAMLRILGHRFRMDATDPSDFDSIFRDNLKAEDTESKTDDNRTTRAQIFLVDGTPVYMGIVPFEKYRKPRINGRLAVLRKGHGVRWEDKTTLSVDYFKISSRARAHADKPAGLTVFATAVLQALTEKSVEALFSSLDLDKIEDEDAYNCISSRREERRVKEEKKMEKNGCACECGGCANYCKPCIEKAAGAGSLANCLHAPCHFCRASAR